MRFYFYVAPLRADGPWEVRSSLEVAQRHNSRDAAMSSARQACRRHWEGNGVACGVRVFDAGAWVEELLVGETEDPPASADKRPG